MLTENQIVDLPLDTVFWTYEESIPTLGNLLHERLPVRPVVVSSRWRVHLNGEFSKPVGVAVFSPLAPDGTPDLNEEICSGYLWDSQERTWRYQHFYLTEKEAIQSYDLLFATEVDKKLRQALNLVKSSDWMNASWYQDAIEEIRRKLSDDYVERATDATQDHDLR